MKVWLKHKSSSKERPAPTRGKNEARRLRLTGKVPAVLYGGKGDAITLALNTKQVGAILRSESGHNTLFQVDLGGKHEPAILKDWLVDPVTGNLLHVDLLRVAMDVRMRVKVPVHTFGEPAGVKAARRRLRSRHPRSRNRVLARGHSDANSRRTSAA